MHMINPTIVITAAPAWAQSVTDLLSGEYAIHHYTDRAPGYVARLTDDRAAMILVDGDDPDWQFWTATPKVSPATRRIPVLVISDDANRRADALLSGADFTLAPDEITSQLLALVRDNARVLDPALIAQFEDECGQPLPPLAVQGIEKFNAGEYYPQHDLFEELWMQTETPVRNLYQAILQVGIAYYQITRGNHRGALKMLLRSVQWLSMLPDVCQGVNIKQLREDSYRVRAELERMNPQDIAQFDRTLLKPVKLIDPHR
jgi:predicted metal-dependent hydrolase